MRLNAGIVAVTEVLLWSSCAAKHRFRRDYKAQTASFYYSIYLNLMPTSSICTRM